MYIKVLLSTKKGKEVKEVKQENQLKTEQKLELKGFQRMSVAWLKDIRKGILGLDQGLGKTVISAAALAELPARKVLVVCPASMRIPWKRELKKWANIDAQIYPESGQCTIVSWASLSKIFGSHLNSHIILDECQYMKSRTAKRTKAAMKLVKSAEDVWALSGTPIPNRPIEIWPLGFSMGMIPNDYRSFGYKYCAGWKTPWNTEDFTGASNLEELSELVSKRMLRITKDMAKLQLPSKSYQIISLDLPLDKREKEYKLQDLKGKSTPLGLVGLSEILQAQGLKKVKPAVAHIKDVLEHEQKLIVFAYHKAVVAELKEQLKDFGVVELVGSTNMKARQEAVDRFQKDPGVRIFLGNTEACKTGLTLTAANRAVFVESSWSPKDIDQMVDRMHRIGQSKPVLAQFLTTHQSIDEYQLRRALEKLQVIDEIIKPSSMDGCNERGKDMTEWQVIVKKQGERIALALEEISLALHHNCKNVKRIADYLEQSKEVVEAEPKPKTKKRGRPKKNEQSEARKALAKQVDEECKRLEREEEESLVEQIVDNVAEAIEATFDDCRMALKNLLDLKGKDVCHEQLKECGAGTLSQLKEENYTKFVGLCKGKIDAKD